MIGRFGGGLAALALMAGVAVAADPAIGRLNQADFSARSHCTFVAIGPQTALTAKHCVENAAPGDITLLYGYARAAWAAKGGVSQIVPLRGDVAALCLSEPPPAERSLGAAVARSDAVRVVGYGRPRVHVQGESMCTVLALMGADALLDCPATKGGSGGPVLDEAGDVVAVMSRTARGSSIAATVPANAARACAPG